MIVPDIEDTWAEDVGQRHFLFTSTASIVDYRCDEITVSLPTGTDLNRFIGHPRRHCFSSL